MYTKEYFAASVTNTSNAAELMKCCNKQLNGDNQLIITGLAADTGITSGDAVNIQPTSSGWLVDDIVDNKKQMWGVLQNTPGEAGAEARVCMGGFTYMNANDSTKYATAFGGTLEFCVDVPSATSAVTGITTNHIGWPVTSGVYATAGQQLVFIDRPWEVIDTTS